MNLSPSESTVSQLENPDAGEQFQAVSELGDLGHLAKPAVPALVDTLGASDDLALKHEVLITLGRIGTDNPVMFCNIVVAFGQHRSQVVSHWLCQCLKRKWDLDSHWQSRWHTPIEEPCRSLVRNLPLRERSLILNARRGTGSR
jgi:hypothetical protein